MSFLAQVAPSNSRKVGIRAVLAGVEGIGKTTLACNAPRPLLAPMEQGATGLKINSLPLFIHFEHVLMFMDEAIGTAKAGQFPFLSIIFDSVTALERLIHQAVLEEDPTWAKGNRKAVTMESAHGGYGKAYLRANEKYENFLSKCDELALNCGINIVMTCHVFAAKVMDPTVGEYETWDLLLHSPKNQKTYGKREMTTQWADLIGFLHEPLFITEGKNMNMGISANKGRILGIARTPGYVAKNRFNVVNEIVIPKENPWNHLAASLYQGNGFDCYNRDV